jgi:hypothetical protein
MQYQDRSRCSGDVSVYLRDASDLCRLLPFSIVHPGCAIRLFIRLRGSTIFMAGNSWIAFNRLPTAGDRGNRHRVDGGMILGSGLLQAGSEAGSGLAWLA